MILLCGIPSEAPLAMVRRELRRLSVPYVVFNQRQSLETDLSFQVSSGRVSGELSLDGRSYRLERIVGVYQRLMDDQRLPELQDEPVDSNARRHCRALHDGLIRWAEISRARVVNRVGSMGSNFSKPYQAQIIQRYGFLTPETLISNDPAAVREFRRKHGRVVYKSISGVRSIVQTLDSDSAGRLDRIRWCPTQFQEYVDGFDVRVHTVGGKAFASRIRADATDYRYAHLSGQEAELEPFDLTDGLAGRCRRLAEHLGLAFAGIDLRIDTTGEVYCLEVNPSPAFSYYESHTGQKIARAVARYLAGRF